MRKPSNLDEARQSLMLLNKKVLDISATLSTLALRTHSRSSR